MDACDALIKWDEFEKESNYGWEIDRIFPECKAIELGIKPELYNASINLRVLHYLNNRIECVVAALPMEL